MESLYQVLGVSSHVSALEIRQAYRRMALIHHPDKGGDTRAFRLIRMAFETLSSEIRRRSYDEHVALYQHRNRSSEGAVKRSKSTPSEPFRTSPGTERPSGKTAADLRLGAGVPPRKHDPEGRKPRAVLLRSLRKLHGLLAPQSHSKRRLLVESLTPLLREELVAFILHQRARTGSSFGFKDVQQTRSGGIRGPRRYGGNAAAQQRFWLCCQIGRAVSGGRSGFPCS